jgi:serine O-acetyltransferase
MPAESKSKLDLPPEVFNTPELRRKLAQAILRDVYARYPRFWESITADTKIFLQTRGEDRELDSWRIVLKESLRLAWETDAWLGLALYRARCRFLAHGVPVLPTLLHRICIAAFQMDIGEPVVIEPGVYIPHGQLVIDGNVEIGKGATITPWVTIGLRAGNVEGPKIGRFVFVGTGAKVIGDIRVGNGATIGAGAVVVNDVAPRTCVGGIPAKPIVSPRRPDVGPRSPRVKRDPS